MAYVELSGVSKSFALRGRRGSVLKAATDISFRIPAGTTFGLVGESGSGKSTVAHMIAGLLAADSGRITVGGRSHAEGGRAERTAYLQQLSIVFQNPFASLDPKMTILQIIAEPLLAFRRVARRALEEQVGTLLRTVGLSAEHMHRYPHEFSGGQRQRIAIARAISVNPRFLVLDEPTSALDVSVQALIINLLGRLQAANQLTYLFISHNMGVVRHISSLIGVMYRGRLLETGESETIITAPAHPYTQYLIAAVPRMGPLPDPSPAPAALAEETGEGCPFVARCPRRLPQCASVFPGARTLGSGQTVYCHLY